MSDGATTETLGPPERRRDDELFRQQRGRFAMATEAAQIGYWFCNLPFDQLMWDERVKQHFWLPPDATVDIDLFFDRLHPEDRERTRLALERAIETRGRYDIEYRTVSPDGRVKWIRALGRPAYDAQGEPVRFDGVTQDVTAQKEAEAARDRAMLALVRNEKLALVGRLAATISHEINNPLASVGNLLYLIERSVTDAATLHYVKTAMSELERISNIVSQTLTFNRRTDKPATERISQILDSALAMYAGRLRNSRIEVRRRYADADRLQCMPSELRQVFANLIANALDAMPGSGRLTVRTRKQAHPRTGQPGMRVSIADTGTGMSAETLKNAFEPFFSTKGEKGTGLGLWLSREILAKQNASIRVRSRQTPGASGTVFSIWLPEALS